MRIELTDNRIEVKAAISDAARAWLYEAVLHLEGQVKRNTKVKTGQTKGSWGHAVDEEKLEGYVGSDYPNAVYEEFGTGEYALNGDGRKGGWRYVDEQGVGHFTYGKRPRRALFHAFTSQKAALIRLAEERFRGLDG